MKRFIYSCAVIAALICSSCDQERLDIEQKAVSATDNFYKTDQDAFDAITAVYAQFATQIASSDGICCPELMLLNYSADDVFSAGKNKDDHMEFRVFDEFRYDSDNPRLNSMYQRYYKVIYACNLVIDYITPDTEIKARCVAEARVIRAYCHMMAALSFNRPPLIDHLITVDDKPTNVESQESLLKWCIKECEESLNDLDERQGKNDQDGAFKVTKGFAYFVAGKSAVFAGDMVNAERILKPLVESPNYELVPGERFRDLFHIEGNGCKEKIFEISVYGNSGKYSSDEIGTLNRGRWMVNNVLNWRSKSLAATPLICGANTGWGGGAINWKFAEKMYNNDGDGPRRKATFITADEFLYDHTLNPWPNDIKADGTEMTKEEKMKDPNRGIKVSEGMFSRGMYLELKNIESPNDCNVEVLSQIYNATAYRIARLAEAYLLYAEACLANNHITEGEIYFHKIQRRAKAPEKPLTLENLQDEKQYELWFESCRFHDMVRWGIVKECEDKVVDQVPVLFDDIVIEGTPYYKKEHHMHAELTHPLSSNLSPGTYGFVKGKHEYFPFPKSVIEINPELHQILGWADNK